MRKRFMLAAIATSLSTPAMAGVTMKVGVPACLTEDLFDQLIRAAEEKDMDALNYLSKNGCMVSGKPTKVTVLDLDSTGMLAHVRAYRGKIAAEMWTATLGLDGYDPLRP
jgi:hypothetical protein